MKRILIFSLTYFPTRVGGAEIAIREITARLAGEYAFDLITLQVDSKLPKTETDGALTVHRVGPPADIRALSDRVPFQIRIAKAVFPVTAFLKALELHARRRYDGVWAMMAAYAGFAAVLFSFARPHVPYLLTLQEGDPIPHILKKVRLVRPLFDRIFTRAAKVQAISGYLARFAHDMRCRGDAAVVPNGVDLAHFAKAITPEERAQARQAWGVTDEDTALITTSRLARKNGLDEVIRALARLPRASFVIYGTGEEEAALKSLAEKAGVAPRVRFMGQAPYENLPRLLAAADIFIRPSRSEGMGNSFIEAMAAGIPVIATQEGGIADFLFDARRNPGKEPTGFAVDADSPGEIAEAVERIRADAEGAKRVAENARRFIRGAYEWDTIAAEMGALFAALTARARMEP